MPTQLAVDELATYFEELTGKDLFSGVVLITKSDEQCFAAAYGHASRAWRVPNSLATRFDTASITKLFTAVATLQLVDRGYLELATRAIEFLQLKDTSISADATVYHLLTHTSGIGDDCEEEDGERYEDLWLARPNYTVSETADFLPQFAHKPANFRPGAGCRYCNCGYILLGLMIEQATGMGYRDYVRQHIFGPAGMEQSDFLHMGEVHPLVAEGSDPIRADDGRITGWKRNIFAFPPIGSPDSGAHVTAGDLDRFLRAVHAGTLLSPQMTRAFFTPQVPYRDRGSWAMHYGMGLWFYVEPSGHVVCYQKEGINAGVSAVIRHFPAHDINVILLSNMEAGVWKPIWAIHEMVVEGR